MTTSTLLRQDLHTISLLVANKPGVLIRIATMFSRRAFNIESLVVSPAQDGRFSRMTITAEGNTATLEQIIKQLSKLVDVLHASEHSHQDAIEQELALIKVKAGEKQRTSILQIVDHFKVRTVDFTDESLVIQATGNTSKLDALIKMLSKYDILEVVRTGKVLMARGLENT